jgi:hypothetical protein|tara:strand:+ start:360 stop:968 length:609 start_codon:yes stop_codon:yes gene_type:complete
MTELEAVNTMLVTIGEQPVSSLDNLAGLQDASIAKQILSNISRAVQSKGWVFNLDLQVTYTPDANGEINLGANVLRIDTTTKVRSTTKDIVERGGKLYDREKNTSIFTDTVKVDRVIVLNFDDLPEVARRYIAIRSARVFHDRVVGSGELHDFFREDEQVAWQELLEYEGEVGDYTIFDDYDVYRIIERDTGKSRQTTTPTT